LAVYRGADIITPNLAEFRLAGGDTSSEAAMFSSARAMLMRCGIAAMLLTRSEHGMTLITPNDIHHFPAQVLEVSDVTGAGDTVIATLAVMLGAGMALPQAVEVANLAAGIVVGKLGAATVSPQELAAKLNKHLFSQGDVYLTPFDKVLQHIEFAKQNGERIVFTNGCFDILHAGHVRYLAQAKAQGDRLVVGLNSDASISRLKGPSRPVNPLEERATVLASLASVDWVLPFGDDPAEQDTPLHLILKVKPDVLVKGGDYTVDTIVGAQEVLASGGEVKVLQFVDGCSTSNIISKIKG
jgi:D-beta-D-heptose 7-phosphate kinase/D-beta-D-heptose 1-phosphate adenosyltransferase